MRKIISTEFYTIDGMMSDPEDNMEWVLSNFSQDLGEYVDKLYRDADTLFLGAVTYKIMASYWPGAETNPQAYEGDDQMAPLMNNIQKIVFSKHVLSPEWQNSTRREQINVNEIREMKTMRGKNMLIAGSASIVDQFTDLNLIDEYHFLVHPVILKSGKPLFSQLKHRKELNLLWTKSFTNGVVLLGYEPKSK